MDSDYRFGNFCSFLAFVQCPAVAFAVFRRVERCNDASGIMARTLNVVIMPNSAQNFVPNNSQSDNRITFWLAEIGAHNLESSRSPLPRA